MQGYCNMDFFDALGPWYNAVLKVYNIRGRFAKLSGITKMPVKIMYRFCHAITLNKVFPEVRNCRSWWCVQDVLCFMIDFADCMKKIAYVYAQAGIWL